SRDWSSDVCSSDLYIRIDALPVLESSFQHGRTHAAKQASGNSFNQARALRVVEYLAYQDARLSEVVVFRVQGVGAAYHFAIGFPAVFCLARRVGPGAAFGIGRINRLVAAVLVGHVAVEHI